MSILHQIICKIKYQIIAPVTRLARVRQVNTPTIETIDMAWHRLPPEEPQKTPSVLNRRLLVFSAIVLGFLANWLWNAAWSYLADPSQGVVIGGEMLFLFLIRLFLSLCLAALTFLPVYHKIDQLSSENWVVGFVAFQNGFFWQAALNGVAQGFQ